jgi:hypothetical protein
MKNVMFVALIAVLITCTFSAFPVKAQEQTYVASFDMGSIYAPAKFVIEFTYCPNFSGPVNMQTHSGNSLWTAQISPIGFEFDAKDIDIYEFDLRLVYNATIEQVMTLSYWSGDLAANSMRVHVTGLDLLVHFRMVVNTEPVIPSKESIAEAVVFQVKQDLADYQGQIANLVVQLQQNIQVMWAVIVVDLLAAIMALVVAFYAIRSSHQERRR